MKAVNINRIVLAAIQAKPKGERLAIGRAIRGAQEYFGQPQAHRGLGIRKVSARYYEIRGGLDYRLIFTNESDCLRLVAEGNHDQVKRFLKQQP